MLVKQSSESFKYSASQDKSRHNICDGTVTSDKEMFVFCHFNTFEALRYFERRFTDGVQIFLYRSSD